MRKVWIVLGAVLVFGGGLLALRQGFFSKAPKAVTLESSTAAPDATFDGSFDGTWRVDTTSGSFSNFTSSWAGYRAQEELANIGANTAVGRTPDVTGTMTVRGTTIEAVAVSVDLRTLRSDKAMRDRALRERGLESDRYPTATFRLAQPIPVGRRPPTGQVVHATAVGDFTLHGTTRRIRVPIDGKWTGTEIEVAARFPVALADYGITKPTSFVVLSIADTAQVELHLLFRKAAQA